VAINQYLYMQIYTERLNTSSDITSGPRLNAKNNSD